MSVILTSASLSATGAGKSSLLNALLDGMVFCSIIDSRGDPESLADNIVPTSGMRGE